LFFNFRHMEFFRTVPVHTTVKQLNEHLIPERFDELSAQLFCLEKTANTNCRVGTIWGEFTLNRTQINGGLRFSLVECPNGLCWSITSGYQPSPKDVVIHLILNRTAKNPEFIEEVHEFLDSMEVGLKQFFDPEKLSVPQGL
jgi:hypothetical protein